MSTIYTGQGTKIEGGLWLKLQWIIARWLRLPVRVCWSCPKCSYRLKVTARCGTKPGLSILSSAMYSHSCMEPHAFDRYSDIRQTRVSQ